MRQMMMLLNRFLMGLMVFVCLSMPAWAASALTPAQQVQAVQTLEDTLFALRYDQEPVEARLERLEEIVFGQAMPGKPTTERIERLKTVINSNSLAPLKENPPPVTAATAPSQTPPSQPHQQPIAQAPPAQPDATDYPTVTQMEQKVFGKTFTSEDLANRLARLEKHVFRTVQTGPLSDRMDNLKIMVLGDQPAPAPAVANAYPPAQPYPYAQVPPNSGYAASQAQPYYAPPVQPAPTYQPSPYPPGYQQYPPAQPAPNGYTPPGYGATAPQQPTPDMLSAMNDIEKEVIGQTFPQEPFDSRLNRVETKVFNSTAPELSYEDRLTRIIAVSSAGGAPQSPQARAKSTFMNLLPVILTILPMILL